MNEAIHIDQSVATIEVAIEENRRLLLRPWENAAGCLLVSVAPQYRDRTGTWRLAHSGLMLCPSAARDLGPALAAVADAIEAGEVTP